MHTRPAHAWVLMEPVLKVGHDAQDSVARQLIQVPACSCRAFSARCRCSHASGCALVRPAAGSALGKGSAGKQRHFALLALDGDLHAPPRSVHACLCRQGRGCRRRLRSLPSSPTGGTAGERPRTAAVCRMHIFHFAIPGYNSFLALTRPHRPLQRWSAPAQHAWCLCHCALQACARAGGIRHSAGSFNSERRPASGSLRMLPC